MNSMVGSCSINGDEVGRGTLKHIAADEVEGVEQISYANFGTRNGCDVLVRKVSGRYQFRLIYLKCEWVVANELPPLYREIAEAWLKLRRKGVIL